MLVLLIGLSWDSAPCRAQPVNSEALGAQVLTRVPVHEAFAGMVPGNPLPGIVVTQAPSDGIEELPPEERPEGDNTTWIPGYWAWDDERNDFLWISGTWRAATWPRVDGRLLGQDHERLQVDVWVLG